MNNHIILSNDHGASRLEGKPAPEFTEGDLPPGWQGLMLQDSGIFLFMFRVSADAEEFPIHASSDEWLAYVVSGSGTLYAGSAALLKTEGIEYRAGDFITFEADTPHGWRNGGEESRILFVKRS